MSNYQESDKIETKAKIKKAFPDVLIIVLFVLFSLSSCLFCLGTSDFKLDHLSYSINNINRTTILDDDFRATILNIHSNEKTNYNDLLSYFYYNSLNGPTRLIASNNVSCDELNLHIESQDTLSIRSSEEEDGGYYLDKGLYYTYFSDDILGPRQYLIPRFGCDSFVFISDTFADKLISKYNISDEEGYKTLITNEEYSVLSLIVDGNQTISLSINNILYSNKRNGPRTHELYGDFGVVARNNTLNNIFTFEFEIDLKDNPYCIRNTFKSVNELGYSTKKSRILLKRFDETSAKYIIDERLTEKYYKSWSSFDALFYTLFAVSNLLIIVSFSIIVNRTKRESLIPLFCCFCCFAVFGIISSFIYIYPLFSIPPLVGLIILIFLYRKEVKLFVKRVIFRKSLPLVKKTDWHTVQI